MRVLASFVDRSQPAVMGISEIDAGDALSLATRFALQWAYRGKQALFWKSPVRAHAVHDCYLPIRAARVFDRRGLLMVDAHIDTEPCTLAATELSAERHAFVPELRFARRHLRGNRRTLLFVDVPVYRVGFTDLGFTRIEEGIFARGFSTGALAASVVTI